MSKAKKIGKQKANRGNQVKRERCLRNTEAIISKYKQKA